MRQGNFSSTHKFKELDSKMTCTRKGPRFSSHFALKKQQKNTLSSDCCLMLRVVPAWHWDEHNPHALNYPSLHKREELALDVVLRTAGWLLQKLLHLPHIHSLFPLNQDLQCRLSAFAPRWRNQLQEPTFSNKFRPSLYSSLVLIWGEASITLSFMSSPSQEHQQPAPGLHASKTSNKEVFLSDSKRACGIYNSTCWVFYQQSFQMNPDHSWHQSKLFLKKSSASNGLEHTYSTVVKIFRKSSVLLDTDLK